MMSEENLYTFENEAYRKTYWHTCSHIMAQAVKRLWPEVKLAIGPSIDLGWYYDFDAPFSFTNEHLEQMGLKPSDIDYVLLSHLDCDHANGLRQVKEAKHILVSKAEMVGTTRKNFQIWIRFQKRWWEGVDLHTFDWNGTEGPVGKSYDVLGDGSLTMVNIPGHSEGLCALKIRNTEGKYVLLFADGGYATKSWKEMITSGITLDKKLQRQSLQWIREQSMSPDC